MRVILFFFFLKLCSQYLIFPFKRDLSYPSKHYFTIILSLGNQTLTVQLDTSSANTWVPSSKCGSCKSKNITLYDPSSSSTSSKTESIITLYDEDGIVSGYESYDNLLLSSSFSINNFGFVQVTEYGKEFSDFPSGKIGLGYRGWVNNKFNIINHLASRSLIVHREFSIEFNNDTNGNIIFDDYLAARSPYVCNVTSYENINILYRQSWICSLSHIIISELDPDFIERINIKSRVMFDSAYEYISIPYKYYYTIKEELFDKFVSYACVIETQKNSRMEEVYHVCKKSKMDIKKANFTLIIQGYAYTVELNNLFKKINDTHCESLLRFAKEISITDEKESKIPIDIKIEKLLEDTKEDDDINVWIIGFPIMKNYLMRFDYDNSQIGFAPTSRGSIINMTTEWNKWNKEQITNQTVTRRKHYMHLLYGCSFILAFVLICIIAYICIKKRRSKDDEIRPLVKNGV